ncbi:replication factor C subunit 4 isoform X1 [Pteropus alecto]|uniref:replication factor C subunit 4 isoform X1 n=1 Tax=Pteropus alecto TaxID=9402 RepID=UPI000D53AD0A|nr:replication factor C subunit 4 isoform X1 [Pteropus alecto]
MSLPTSFVNFILNLIQNLDVLHIGSLLIFLAVYFHYYFGAQRTQPISSHVNSFITLNDCVHICHVIESVVYDATNPHHLFLSSFFLWISQALPLKWLGQLLALKHPEYKQSVWWLLQYDSRPELFRLRVLELNASDERGIQVVREKVKNFAQLTVSGSRSDGKPCPPFKIVILDEADSMTSAAQAALRRTMEKESKTTRFCLICNYVSRIIEPLTSRCSKFRFKPLSDKIQQQRLLDIAGKEHVKISNEGVSYLVKVSEGDLRKAITFLQSATRLTGGKEITEKVITDIAGVIPAETIDGIFAACQSGSFDKLEAVVKDLIDEGHAATQLVNQLHDVIVENDNLSDKQKSIITEKLAEVDKCLADGADEHLQLISLCATVMQQLTQNC